MVDNKGAQQMKALYLELDGDDGMQYMRVENKAVIEIVNQIENFGVHTQYQRHLEVVDFLTQAQKKIIDNNVELLTEAKTREFLQEFIALGGTFVEAGVALYDHPAPNNASADQVSAVSEKLAEYYFYDEDGELDDDDD
jgi:RecJ-like exonuclease